MKQQIISQRFNSSGYLQPYLDDFINELSKNGYTILSVRSYYDSIAHFITWVKKKGILLDYINYGMVDKFSKHHCRCIKGRRTPKISRRYANRVRHFISYLYKKGIIISKLDSPKIPPAPYIEEFKNYLQLRGLAQSTITRHEYFALKLPALLGNNPKKYNATKIKRIICRLAKQKSRYEVKALIITLRSYLRFLITKNICVPGLDNSVPAVVEWRLSSLPKYLTSNEVDRVIAACNDHTKQGIRDRAIILLLSRLGLRAGDISNMSIRDIDWLNGTLRVSGKGRKEVLLPLPQDAGDAILTYLKKARPTVSIDKLFLCLNAPYRPFPTSNLVSSIVSASLDRAKIKHPPSCGANLLRHSAATNMLRNGATLEAVSAILRHKSLDMTSYYAKVDIPRLIKIAQPWPEGISC